MQSQEKNYAFLLELQGHVLSLLKDGAVVKDVCAKAAEYVHRSHPELEDHFVKTLGARVRWVIRC